MPFTGSHPAAVLPFLGTPLPASALVIGSMAPDIPYYLPFQPALYTHTALSVVTTDLLLGVVAWSLWHGLLAAPALSAAPRALRARLADVPLGLSTRLGSTRIVLLAVAALVLGSATHVLWDEFTHPRRWGTEHLSALAENWGALPGYRWLQYLSGLLGGLVLVAWFVRWLVRTPAQTRTDGRAPWWPWAVVVAIAAVTGAAGAASAPSLGAAGFAGATWAGGAALCVALVLATAWHVRQRSG